MRSKRFYLSVVATILLLFVVGTVLAQEATGPPESADPDQSEGGCGKGHSGQRRQGD